MIITFLGHSSVQNCNFLYEEVKRTILENIDLKDRNVFYCGGYGDFDNLCARICREIKNTYQNCEIIFVTPYFNKSQQKKISSLINSKLYDSSLYPPIESTPYRFAISKRNEWMVRNSDIIVAYVNHKYGGAYKSLSYALQKKKRVINLAK